MADKNSLSLTYSQAGVDIDKANQLTQKIKQIAAKTERNGVLAGVGGFGALFELPLDRYDQPILVSSSDGVGTKLKIAHALNKHDTIGIDLVAMCANDILTSGAEPLFFLDYFATGQLNLTQAQEILAGIGQGCELAGTALIGGETAEMPGMYHSDEYDLAGFCVGVVEKSAIIDGKTVKEGDILIGLSSSGPHSNGYSLIRRVIDEIDTDWSEKINHQSLSDILIAPTKIYVRSILSLCRIIQPHALAHITGGGLVENLPRIMPPHTVAKIDFSSWQRPEIFHWLQSRGNIPSQEMLRTFNLGVGFVVYVAEKDVDTTIDHLTKNGEKAWVMGKVESCDQEIASVVCENYNL